MNRSLLLLLLACLLIGSETLAQSRSVSGQVISSEDGSAIPGVSVFVKGTNQGTTTDAEGRYTINAAGDNTTLIFSFIGFKMQEIVVGNRLTLNVSLENEAKELGEVVITAFGVSQEKRALGYAVQEVGGDKFTTTRDQNIVSSLSGRIAGANVVTSSGGVGSSSRIVLRGASSITGNNEPLFVVDGIPISNRTTGNSSSGGGADFGNGAADINPDDVESITVLGPNAAALYGSRASNGVILITTKSGKGSKGLGVSVNVSNQYDSPMRLPDFQNSYGQGPINNFFQYIDGANGEEGTDESWGMPLDIGLEAVQWTSGGKYAEAWRSRPDNVRNFFQTGRLTTQNISLSGSNTTGNYRLSLTNLEQVGTLINTDLSRKTIALNAGLNLSPKLSTDFSANYVRGKSDNRPTYGYSGQNPIQQFIWSGRNVDLQALKNYKKLPSATTGLGAGITPINWNDRFQNNPYWSAYNSINANQRDRVFGNVKVNYKLTDWLSVFVRTGVDYFTEGQTRIQAKGMLSSSNANGFYQEYKETNFEANTDFLVSAHRDINTDFTVNASFGGNRRDQKFEQMAATANELELPGVYNLSNVKSGIAPIMANFKNQKRVNSLYGSFNLSYKNYLFLDVSGRNDWSSTLPVNGNSFFYPGVSLSATLSDIFEIESNTLSFLKARGSWVQVGSDTNPYALIQTFSFRSPWGAVLSPTEANSLLNPQLKPEITTSVEAGIEASFFKGRLNATITGYKKSTRDQIIPIQISASSGYTSRNTNIGEMVNKGFEIQLGGSPVVLSNGFEWNVSFNFARNFNMVTELAEGLESLTLGGQWNVSVQARVGEAYGSLYGPGFKRDPKGNIIHGEDGLPEIDTNYKILGNVTPKFTSGITNTFSFRGLSLDILIDGRYGGDVYSMTTTWGRYAGILEETMIGRELGIVGKGVIANGDGTYRRNDVVVSAEAYNNRAYSNNVAESSIFDGTFIKLRQVQLGYRLPNTLLKKLPIRDVTVSVVGRNLALLYSTIPHIDPETSFSSANGAQGMEFGQIPTNRSIGFNINFKL